MCSLLPPRLWGGEPTGPGWPLPIVSPNSQAVSFSTALETGGREHPIQDKLDLLSELPLIHRASGIMSFKKNIYLFLFIWPRQS